MPAASRALAPRHTQTLCAAITPKEACDFRDPLCSWRDRYMFGGAAIGGAVYYLGGLDANDPTYPINGSELETFDMVTSSPRTLQTVPSLSLNTSRYRQQMAPWGANKIVMVGGQFDDINGASEKTMSLVVLDLTSREWTLKRGFWQNNEGEE